MGASRQGMMSIRERINLVLKEIEIDDDEDAREDIGDTSVVPIGSNDVPSTSSATLAEVTTQTLCTKSADNNSIQAPCDHTDHPTSSTGILVNSKNKNKQQTKLPSNLADQLAFLQRLASGQLVAIRVFQERHDQSEIEIDQLHDELDSERKKRIRQLEEFEKKLKLKDEEIADLKCQLSLVTTRPRPVEDKGTCTTPSLPSTSSLGGGDEDSRLRKRRKLDGLLAMRLKAFCSLPPPAGLSLPPNSRRVENFLSLGSLQQLSAAGATQKSSLFPRENRQTDIHPGYDDDLSNDPPDEFSDELESYNLNKSSPQPGPSSPFNRSQANQVGQTGENSYHAPNVQLYHHQSQFSQRSHLAATSRPSPSSPKTHSPRLLLPVGGDTRRQCLASSLQSAVRNNRIMSPSHPVLNNTIGSGNSRLIGTASSISSGSGGPPSRDLPHRNRNNFLKLNRSYVLEKRPAPIASLSSGPLSLSKNLEESSQHNQVHQSPESFSVDVAGAATVEIDDEVSIINQQPAPIPIQKTRRRGGGRPPGSRLPNSTSSNLEAISSSIISNGAGEQAPPPRYSQRGRLLKPNRGRYSPDPESTGNSREKDNRCAITKKTYFVNEPSVQDGFSGVECGDVSVEDFALEALPTPTLGIEEDELIFPPSTDDAEIALEPKTKSQLVTVEVPLWRSNIVEGFEEGEEHMEPDDDMSDEAFMKRHQKLENKEKQRKRWDSQRMREENYRENLKRKQEEREKQKELRRNRKRNRRIGTNEEEEIILPSVEDIKAIHIDGELPVGAFGHPIPITEKVDFQLKWIPSPTMLSVEDNNPSNSDNLNKASIVQGEDCLLCCSSKLTSSILDTNKNEETTDLSSQRQPIVTLCYSAPPEETSLETSSPPSPSSPPPSSTPVSTNNSILPSIPSSKLESSPISPGTSGKRFVVDNEDNRDPPDESIEYIATVDTSPPGSPLSINLQYFMCPDSAGPSVRDHDEVYEEGEREDDNDNKSKITSAGSIADEGDEVEFQRVNELDPDIISPTLTLAPSPTLTTPSITIPLQSCSLSSRPSWPDLSSPQFKINRSSGTVRSIKSERDKINLLHCPVLLPSVTLPSPSSMGRASIAFIFPNAEQLSSTSSPSSGDPSSTSNLIFKPKRLPSSKRLSLSTTKVPRSPKVSSPTSSTTSTTSLSPSEEFSKDRNIRS